MKNFATETQRHGGAIRYVAQTCSLLYRRLAVGKALGNSIAESLADVPQNRILQYGRLKICATPTPCLSASVVNPKP